jgi:hypothetical protein
MGAGDAYICNICIMREDGERREEERIHNNLMHDGVRVGNRRCEGVWAKDETGCLTQPRKGFPM